MTDHVAAALEAGAALTENCPVCEGQGLLVHGVHRSGCENCGGHNDPLRPGTGRVPAPFATQVIATLSALVKCRGECGGSGKFKDGLIGEIYEIVCPTCKGDRWQKRSKG
jgi:DnaJ-class molecular chaperone